MVRLEASEMVLLMPGFFRARSDPGASSEPGVSVVDDWRPQLNLFENRAASQAWDERSGLPGQTLSLTEAAARGARHWRPIVSEVR